MSASATADEEEEFTKPTALPDILKMVGWSLEWIGDWLSKIFKGEGGDIDALMTDVPNLVSMVPLVSSTARSARTSTISSTVWVTSGAPTTGTIVSTVYSTRVFVVTGTRTKSSSKATMSATSSAASSATPLDFDNKSLVQAHAGRFPGISRTIPELQSLCADPDIDIVTIGSVTRFSSPLRVFPALPVADFVSLCNSTLSLNPSGPGDCSVLSDVLHDCQQNQGKKLFLAVEIGTDYTIFPNEQSARNLAQNLWDMFGGGKAIASGAAKYGGIPKNLLGVAFDGFEFFSNTTTAIQPLVGENVNGTTNGTTLAQLDKRQAEFLPPTLSYFDLLFATLRSFFDTQAEKPYYISVSLPCTRPSILSKAALHLADFVTVRFMDVPACNVNGPSFTSFLQTWAKDIQDVDESRLGPNGSSAAMASSSSSSIRPRTSTIVSTVRRTATVRIPRPTSSDGFLVLPAQATDTASASVMSTPPSMGNLSVEVFHPHAPYPKAKPYVKRHVGGPKVFMGIPAPSEISQNGPASTMSGVADDATFREILAYAQSSVPGFAGVMLWGTAADLKGYAKGRSSLAFVKDVLESSAKVMAGAMSSTSSSQMVETVVAVSSDSFSVSVASPIISSTSSTTLATSSTTPPSSSAAAVTSTSAESTTSVSTSASTDPPSSEAPTTTVTSFSAESMASASISTPTDTTSIQTPTTTITSSSATTSEAGETLTITSTRTNIVTMKGQRPAMDFAERPAA